MQNCYEAVSPHLIFSSQCMLPAAKKDVLPANQRSMVIYEYVCHGDSQCVGPHYSKASGTHPATCSKSNKTKPLLLRNREPINLNQIEIAKQKVRLNLNLRAIQPLANICWNPISVHATILTRSLKSQPQLALRPCLHSRVPFCCSVTSQCLRL